MKIIDSNACNLCGLEVTTKPLNEDGNLFCCNGCQAVYRVLKAKNQLEGFETHPIFLQALRSGLISNPYLIRQLSDRKKEAEETIKLHLEIGEMWCPSCSEIIRWIVLQESGVIACVVDYSTDLASIEFDPKKISKEKIMSVIQGLGYRPMSLDHADKGKVSRSLYLKFGIAAFCSLNVMMLAYPLYATYFDYDGESYGQLFAWMAFYLSLPVITYSALPIWRHFWGSLRSGFLGMETLVAIGVLSGLLFSLRELWNGGTHVYFDSMTLIITFVLLGKIIESRAKFSAKESLIRLSRSTPRRGKKRFANGIAQYVAVKEIEKGDLLIAVSGEKIVLDGILVEGEGACDESLMTGESIPVLKRNGDKVIAGTLLVQGSVVYQVTAAQDETALSHIIQSIEKEIGSKSHYVRAADQIVRWFVPIVFGVASVTGLVTWGFDSSQEALKRFLAVLLISCPCAIGIAAPAVESYLLNALAALGVIVRNRGVLSHLGNEDLFIFDKTGTVTEGRYQVLQGVQRLGDKERHILHAISLHSNHPSCMAIASYLYGEETASLDGVEEVPGYGMRAEKEGYFYYFGSERWMKNSGVQCQPSDQENCATALYFAKGTHLLTKITLGDQIRPEIPELIDNLLPTPSILLSGDGELAVSYVAKKCCFHSAYALKTPLEKSEFIRDLKDKNSCFVGDGINDAPSLTTATIGISVVSASDISIQVSDILLTTDNLSVIAKLRQMARRGQKIIRQNLFWAFFYNVIGIGLAVGGVLTPVFAAFAMSISSITVILNAQRMR